MGEKIKYILQHLHDNINRHANVPGSDWKIDILSDYTFLLWKKFRAQFNDNKSAINLAGLKYYYEGQGDWKFLRTGGKGDMAKPTKV